MHIFHILNMNFSSFIVAITIDIFTPKEFHINIVDSKLKFFNP